MTDLDLYSPWQEPIYKNQPPHLKKLWDICVKMLDMGLKPTPTRINEVLGRGKRRNLNGRECAIRSFLLDKYGYEPVMKQGFRRSYIRWEKKDV